MAELQHYGILGMHWGVRRQRGPDGLVTSKVETRSPERIAADILKKKNLASLTNAELRTLNERMQLERTYKDLRSSNISAGEKFATNTLTRIGNKLIDKAIDGTLKTVISAILKKK